MQEAHELTSTASPRHTSHHSDGGEELITPTLPPMDRGKGAYTALACSTIAQAPIWGFSVSFGIFQEYYSSHLGASPGSIATIGALQMGIMYLMMPPAFFILTRYPIARRYCAPLGLVLTTISIAASAFVSSINGLIATQGALYALGCGLIFCPVSLAMDEWFSQRKGFAYGVMWAGKSTTGVVLPFAFDALLQKIGLKATLISWAVASALMLCPTLFYLNPRVPIQQRDSPTLSFRFLRYPVFWMMQSGIIIQALGYLMPTTYLATYASDIGLPSISGPILLALFSIASVPGGIFHGMIGDKMSATRVILISSLGSAVPIFLLWGLSKHMANLVVFLILYGFFAGGFSSTWSSMVKEIQRDDTSPDASLLFGLLLGGRGVGFVLGGPISGALLGDEGILSHEQIGYATKYGPMILCTGITSVFGAWAAIWKLGKMYAPRVADFIH